MPTISWFYGVAIRMYFDDHPPPHFHAAHGRSGAQVNILTGEVIRGSLPPVVRRQVRRWALQHRTELEANWRLARAGSIEPLARIAGLDEQDG